MNENPPRTGPALAMLVVNEVPAGIRALDALLKEAHVALFGAGTIHCGLYQVLFGGEVEAVERSMRRALGIAAGFLVDSVLLPDAEVRILPAIRDHAIRWPAPGDTLGVVQTGTPPDLLRAIDRALKGTSVELVEMRVGDGLGGRAIASVWGETPDVEAAIVLAREGGGARGDGSASDVNSLAAFSTAIIRNADMDLVAGLGRATTFFKDWRG
jgi:microcompartment protein CcmL/EutN